MFQLGVAEGTAQVRHVLSAKAPAPPRAGKYPFDHRMYHHVIVVTTLAAIVTGLLMMVRIDTPFWTRNPYLFNDSIWGVMYVVHGLAGVSLIVLVAAHIYFAVRPEKLQISKSALENLRNTMTGTIEEIAYMGNESVFQVLLDSGKQVRISQSNRMRTTDHALTWGDPVHIGWNDDASVVLSS